MNNVTRPVVEAVLPPASVNQGTLDPASIGVDGAANLPSVRTLGIGALQATAGNDSRVVNAVQSSRAVNSGTGLTGGGNLSADRTLAVSFGAAAGTSTQGNDPRVVNAVQSPFAGDVDAGAHKLTNLAAPTLANDAARKAYVDAIPQTGIQGPIAVADGGGNVVSNCFVVERQFSGGAGGADDVILFQPTGAGGPQAPVNFRVLDTWAIISGAGMALSAMQVTRDAGTKMGGLIPSSATGESLPTSGGGFATPQSFDTTVSTLFLHRSDSNASGWLYMLCRRVT
jgi:hypothetical protein